MTRCGPDSNPTPPRQHAVILYFTPMPLVNLVNLYLQTGVKTKTFLIKKVSLLIKENKDFERNCLKVV